MLEIKRKICNICRATFGYGIMIVLFAGGAIFLGFLAALTAGNGLAEIICSFIYNRMVPVMIYASTCLILLGLVTMYLSGEKALTAEKRKRMEVTAEE